MQHPLDAYRLKLNRAELHRQTLQRETDRWLDQHPYELFGEHDPGPPEQYVFRARFFEEVPNHWGVLLGDTIHNARSALDHLVSELILANGGKLTLQTQFPVVLCPMDWPKKSPSRLGRMAGHHKRIIESFQPYHRPDLYGYSEIWSSVEDPLAVLNHLWNVDKHRSLNATPALMRSIGYNVRSTRDIQSFSLSNTVTSWGALVDGAPIISFPVVANGPHPKIELERNLGVYIAILYEPEPMSGHIFSATYPLRDTLDAIFQKLWRIFEVFVDEFA